MSTTRESSPVRPLMTPPDVSEPRAWASRQSLGRIQPHDLVEAPEPDVQRGVGDQLDDLGLREVPAQLGPESVVDLAMVDGELLREPEGGPLARAQEIRGFVVDRGDLRVRRSRMPGPGIAQGESVAAGVEAGDLQPHELAEHGIDGTLAGQGGAKGREGLEHAGVASVRARGRRGTGLVLGLFAEMPDVVVHFVDCQRLHPRHRRLLIDCSWSVHLPPGPMMRQHDRQRQVCYASRACRATGYPTARGATVRPNRIKQMWRDKKCVTMGWLSVSHGFTAEVMARQGFDVLCVDMQHGTTDMSDVWPMLQAISQTDTVPVVRVPWNEPATIMKALDLGAYGIIVPLINTAEDAAKAVAACRYPPVGMRSSGPVRAVHYGGADYLAKANDEIVVMAMIETKEGLANLDKICATPGLDAVYIGPSDLSFALGLAPRGDNPEPVHVATCDKIRDAAHKHRIKAVMHCASAAFAAGAVTRGFDMVMLTSDLNSMIAGARRQLDELKAATAAH